jgi:hypothetical protein
MVLEAPGTHQTLKRKNLGCPPFLSHRLLINVQHDPAVGVPEEILGGLDVHAFLSRQVREAVTE